MKTLAFSYKGKRKTNQDLILEEKIRDNFFLLAVIDGMGGYEHGDLAANLVAESITTYLSTVIQPNPYHIQKAINKANLLIRQRNELMSSNMGATIGGLVIYESIVTCFWVGDVKIFHFRNNQLLFESYPHNMVNELIETNTIIEPIKLAKFKHIVTRSIQGDIKNSKVDTHIIQTIEDSDIIMICSDGVHDLFEGLQIREILGQSAKIENAVDIIKSRLFNEASDNYSCLITSPKRNKDI